MERSDSTIAHTSGTSQERLWAPWRMRYVGKRESPPGCIFCSRPASGGPDAAHLILHRGEHSFVIMNLYPYNTGHVMIVPNAHVPDLDSLDDTALTEMALTLPRITRTLQRVLDCQGFNIGLNIGAIAGAGVADHLHQHVVPRWHGDVNFMPVVGQTMVMPELVPVTYAKVRAELAREYATEPLSVPVILRSSAGNSILVHVEGKGWRLPSIEPRAGEPIWRTATNAIDRGQGRIELESIAVLTSASQDRPLALIFRAMNDDNAGSGAFMPLDEARARLPEAERAFLAEAFR
ncbi:MAG TPA: HIT domain-containing protein [Thermomicrobiales bacterium]|nr:HIT domain-containing protein [Thermomicrobiales bacterium]